MYSNLVDLNGIIMPQSQVSRPVPPPNVSVAQAAVLLVDVVLSLAFGDVWFGLKRLAVVAPGAVAFVLLQSEPGLEGTLRAVGADVLEKQLKPTIT